MDGKCKITLYALYIYSGMISIGNRGSKKSLFDICIFITLGAIFTKGLSQVLGLSWLYFYTKVKPKTWLRPFVNTTLGKQDTQASDCIYLSSIQKISSIKDSCWTHFLLYL